MVVPRKIHRVYQKNGFHVRPHNGAREIRSPLFKKKNFVSDLNISGFSMTYNHNVEQAWLSEDRWRGKRRNGNAASPRIISKVPLPRGVGGEKESKSGEDIIGDFGSNSQGGGGILLTGQRKKKKKKEYHWWLNL